MPPTVLHAHSQFLSLSLRMVWRPVYFVDLPLLVSSLLAPSRPPGNISWKVDGSWVTVRWDHVKSMDNESTVLGYKVSDTLCHPTLRLSLKMCVCVGLTIPICMSPEYLLRFSHLSQRYHIFSYLWGKTLINEWPNVVWEENMCRPLWKTRPTTFWAR